MKKQVIIFGLALLGAIAVNSSASAQTNQLDRGAKMISFTLPDKGIKVNHSVIANGMTGKIDFVLTNVSNGNFANGSDLVITLPLQPGFIYDLKSISGDVSLSDKVAAAPVLIVKDSIKDKDSVAFTCELVKGVSIPVIPQQIIIHKN